MTDELKPCPFCGDAMRRVVFSGGGTDGPRCFRHAVTGCVLEDLWLEVATWNRRAAVGEDAALIAVREREKCWAIARRHARQKSYSDTARAAAGAAEAIADEIMSAPLSPDRAPVDREALRDALLMEPHYLSVEEVDTILATLAEHGLLPEEK